MDMTLLYAAAKAGAYMITNAAISEPVKDGYRALKAKAHEFYGRRASTALVKLESDESRAEGERELVAAIPDVRSDEAVELVPIVTALLDAIRADARAAALVREVRINLDLDAGRDILVSRLQGASDVNIRAKAARDVSVADIDMGDRDPLGN